MSKTNKEPKELELTLDSIKIQSDESNNNRYVDLKPNYVKVSFIFTDFNVEFNVSYYFK